MAGFSTRFVAACVAAALLVLVGAMQTAAAAKAETAKTDGPAAIRAVLDQSAAAWSRGDLDGFLKSYEDSADVQFVKPDRIVRGIPAIRAMYQEKYGKADAAQMGQLSMSDVDVRMLGKDDAFVIAQFHLARDAAHGGPAKGFFTLLLHQTKDGWRIRVDHTA